MKRSCPACGEPVGSTVFALASHARFCSARLAISQQRAPSNLEAEPTQGVAVVREGSLRQESDAAPDVDRVKHTNLFAALASPCTGNGSPRSPEHNHSDVDGNYNDRASRLSDEDIPDSDLQGVAGDTQEAAEAWHVHHPRQADHDASDSDEDDFTIQNITGKINADHVVAYMLHGLTNKEKTRILTGMKVLTQVALACDTPKANPMQVSSIKTVEAYDKYMDAQAEEHFSRFDKQLIPISSDLDALARLPPVPVYFRDLPEVLTSAFIACSAPAGGFWLRPQPPANFHPGKPESEQRVETPMQGALAHAAYKVCNTCNYM